MAVWDTIVVGLGGLGSVVAHDLASQGMSVMGIDRFTPGHARGSSHGATRVIRQAYYESPAYVPVLLRAYERWAELESGRANTLFHPVGVLEIGSPDGEVIPGVLAAAKQHNLHVDPLDNKQLTTRFPAFHAPMPLVGVFEADGGYLMVEDCVRAWAHRAILAGATLNVGPAVLGWTEKRGKFSVETDQGIHRCTQLVLCPGAWAPQLLPADIGKKLTIRRKPLLWYGASQNIHQDQGTPVWLYELPEGIFYGFPVRGEGQIKLARHSAGRKIRNPLKLDRELHNYDREPIEQFIETYLPEVDATDLRKHVVCMYTMSPDGNFVIGPVPDHPGLWIGSGMSGHGFKMMPALGEALAVAVAGEADTIPSIFAPDRLM